MGSSSIVWITVSLTLTLPALIRTQSSLSAPPKPFKYSKYLTAPSAAYVSYSSADASYMPSYTSYSSLYGRRSASPSKEMLATSALLPAQSIVSSASVPFVFGRKGKDKKGSIVRSKPVFNKKPAAASQSTDSIDWSSDDMQQHPIDEAPRKSNRSLGQPCSYSSDCGSGCCLLDRTTKIRSCQPTARLAQKCTSSQVKGDLYVDACPCARGPDFCSTGNRCTR